MPTKNVPGKCSTCCGGCPSSLAFTHIEAALDHELFTFNKKWEVDWGSQGTPAGAASRDRSIQYWYVEQLANETIGGVVHERCRYTFLPPQQSYTRQYYNAAPANTSTATLWTTELQCQVAEDSGSGFIRIKYPAPLAGNPYKKELDWDNCYHYLAQVFDLTVQITRYRNTSTSAVFFRPDYSLKHQQTASVSLNADLTNYFTSCTIANPVDTITSRAASCSTNNPIDVGTGNLGTSACSPIEESRRSAVSYYLQHFGTSNTNLTYVTRHVLTSGSSDIDQSNVVFSIDQEVNSTDTRADTLYIYTGEDDYTWFQCTLSQPRPRVFSYITPIEVALDHVTQGSGLCAAPPAHIASPAPPMRFATVILIETTAPAQYDFFEKYVDGLLDSSGTVTDVSEYLSDADVTTRVVFVAGSPVGTQTSLSAVGVYPFPTITLTTTDEP